ncbi:hypothetical protein [Thalassotalea sediminis]|uniref:hypothetical protein n=1 Tax=Thalassotalea sediminis TaxID=1759089 RepID=UPI0025739700|nr:hypothetical protein [Thalassotalea sediminis]
MNLFKKALVASAVVSAFSAHAVTVSSDKLKISQEGVAAGNVAVTSDGVEAPLVLDFVVDKLTPAASTITLTFDSSVDLSNLELAVTTSAVNNVVGSGVGTVTNGAEFNYGTGSFTFDKFQVDTTTDTDAHTISFDVNLGNPLTASSAFRLTFDNIANGIVLDGNSTVCYSSVDASENPIESGCAQIAELVTQFDFTVSQEWDGKIERVDQVDFARLYDGTNTESDTLKFKIGNDESLAAALANVDADVTIMGNFTDLAANDFADANFGTTPVALAPAVNGDEDEVTFQIANADFASEGANAGTSVAGYVRFDSNAISSVIPETGAIMVEADFTDGTESTKVTVAGGSWELDATVINVPYMPVLFDNTSSSVYIANESANAANVLATAIDEDGNEYPSVDLGDVPGTTVMKFKQGTLASAFGLTEATKLSITFNIDGYAQDVSAYATIENEGGRTEVSNSQAKVDGK